jgi:hypothetical protein
VILHSGPVSKQAKEKSEWKKKLKQEKMDARVSGTKRDRFEDEDVENPLVSCDGGGCKAGCTLRVHAECYGVKYLHGADGNGLKSRRSSTSGGGKGEKNSHIDKGNEKVKEDDTIYLLIFFFNKGLTEVNTSLSIDK